MHSKKIIPSLLLILLLSNCSTNEQNKNHPTTSENKTKSEVDTTVNHVEEKLNFSSVDSNFIKENFTYKGHIKESIKWNDIEGSHIVFTCETGEFLSKNNNEYGDQRDAELFCYHHIKKNSNYSQIWKIYDYSKNCEVDIITNFHKNSLEITDLNKNGIAEIWTMYNIACKGDVSPSILKLIMYEGNKKYKLEGTSRVELSEEYRYGGEIESILNFDKQQLFLEYAKKKWTKNMKENFQ